MIYDSMIGATMRSVTATEDTLTFVEEGGRTHTFYHDEDCCESVCIYDICGDLQDLVGAPLTEAEEIDGYIPRSVDAESYTWTFYKFGTSKGFVAVRWLGTSNGYYSEGVDYRTT